VRSHNRNHFPPILQNFGVVGMITESDFYAYTLNWPCDPNIFPQRHGCLVGIQVIPITAVSKYWMDH
ncbi:endo-1 3(4)-beta-glucanase 1, partial [Biomphalaria glabrata]